jgi:NADPH:quinone reductase-like Zn-dependent oxidoreductase
VDVAGRVEAVGSQVTQFRPGDEVFGFGVGTFAEYACAGENKIVLKPANLSFEQAAAVPIAALTALQALRDSGAIQAGQKVLIQGASGGVGTFAVQLAKAFGAEVTGVCSTRNLDMVHSLGADHVIDYKKEDFTRNGQRYDLILAVNGYHPIGDYRHSLNLKGIYVMAGGTPAQMFQAITLGPWFSRGGLQKMGMMGTKTNQKDLLFMKDLLESGKVVPVIDACYPLEKTVEAFRYFQKVHARGKIVITMEQR